MKVQESFAKSRISWNERRNFCTLLPAAKIVVRRKFEECANFRIFFIKIKIKNPNKSYIRGASYIPSKAVHEIISDNLHTRLIR
jgi:hypothetical protein